MEVVGFCQHMPIKMKVFSYMVGAAKQLNMWPGTEIDDETLKYKELYHFSGTPSFLVEASFTLFLTLERKRFLYPIKESRLYHALIFEYNVKF